MNITNCSTEGTITSSLLLLLFFVTKYIELSMRGTQRLCLISCVQESNRVALKIDLLKMLMVINIEAEKVQTVKWNLAKSVCSVCFL